MLNPAGQLHCGSSARQSPGAAEEAFEMQLKPSKTWLPFLASTFLLYRSGGYDVSFEFTPKFQFLFWDRLIAE